MPAVRHSIPGFVALVLALSVPFWVLGHAFGVELRPGLPISALVAFAPGIAAIVLVFGAGRGAAVRDLVRRSFDAGRITRRSWYLVVVLFNPAVAVIAFAALHAMGVAVPMPSASTLAIVAMVLVFFVAALGEELGWTGYATEPLVDRFGVLRAGLLLGVLWALFHIVPLLQADRSWAWIAWWALGTIALRAFMVWLYRTAGRSVFAATVFHAMINVSWQLFPVDGSFYDPGVFAVTTVGLAVVLVVAHRMGSRRDRRSACGTRL